jgi:hypothetical protein
LATPELLAKLPLTKGGRAELSMLLHACDRRASLLPVASVLIAAARSAAASSSHRWSWIGLGGILARLVEETERNDDLDTRADALDAWDDLLESGSQAAADALDERVIEST